MSVALVSGRGRIPHDIAAERVEEARLLGTESFVWSSRIIKNALSRSEFILLR